MSTKTCSVCNLTLDISEFYKKYAKCKKCYKKHTTCKHDTRKNDCPECNPKLLCKHGSRKQHCPECNPQILCEHGSRKQNCPECSPKILCEHDIRKKDCPECSPQNFCIHCKHIRGKKRYVESLDKKSDVVLGASITIIQMMKYQEDIN